VTHELRERIVLPVREIEARLDIGDGGRGREHGAAGAAGLGEHGDARGGEQHHQGDQGRHDPAKGARTGGSGRRHRLGPSHER
jgi:hypothetical protein